MTLLQDTASLPYLHVLQLQDTIFKISLLAA